MCLWWLHHHCLCLQDSWYFAIAGITVVTSIITGCPGIVGPPLCLGFSGFRAPPAQPGAQSQVLPQVEGPGYGLATAAAQIPLAFGAEAWESESCVPSAFWYQVFWGWRLSCCSQGPSSMSTGHFLLCIFQSTHLQMSRCVASAAPWFVGQSCFYFTGCRWKEREDALHHC